MLQWELLTASQFLLGVAGEVCITFLRELADLDCSDSSIF